MEKYIQFWNNLNNNAIDNIVKINSIKDIPKFDNRCYDNKIIEYRFTKLR